ncbi:MAG: hypothetical protein ACE37F_30530 [Nannocystaceae bacterium]|nr:hypothetical protein [bacterium]
MRRTLVLLAGLTLACNDAGPGVDTDGGSGGGTALGESSTEPEPDVSSGDVTCMDGCDTDACEAGSHACDGVCVADDDPAHCGQACDACPSVEGGVATCEASVCGVVCDDGWEACEAGCCELDTGVVFEGDASAFSIAVDGEGVPHVSFMVDTYALTYARLTPAGWAVEGIGADGNEYSSAITIDGDDQPVVAYRGADWSVDLARPVDGLWQREQLYSSAFGYGPQLSGRSVVVDEAGGVHVAFQIEDGGTNDAFVRHIWHDGRQWRYETLVESDDNRYSLPTLKLDSSGTLHATWLSYFDFGVHYASGGTGAWETTVALDDGSCCDTSYLGIEPSGDVRLAFENRDDAFVTASPGQAPLVTTTLHAPVSRIGDIAFDAEGGLHYVLSVDTDLIYGSPDGEVTIATGVREFMMTLDGDDVAHVLWADEAALRYQRLVGSGS